MRKRQMERVTSSTLTAFPEFILERRIFYSLCARGLYSPKIYTRLRVFTKPKLSLQWAVGPGLILGLLSACTFLFFDAGYPQAFKRPLKVAHRGGAGLAPENTLAAFRKGLEYHPDAVELDLHLSKDGELVVMHDPDVLRTTDGIGLISDLTLAELKKLNAAAKYKGSMVEPEPVPTLQEVLDIVKGRSGVQIEIKMRADGQRYPGIESKVIEVVRSRSMLRDVVLISFDFPTLQEIKALEPQIETCALISSKYLSRFDVRQDATPVAEDLAAQGFRCVGVNQKWMTDALVSALRTHGFRMGVWTVNDPFSIQKFAKLGVDFITSDRPDLLNQILGTQSP